MTTHTLTRIGLMTAILCIMAPISIPIAPVSLTLATFALYLCVYILEPKEAIFATLLYLFIGAIGIPVFSGYTAGFSRFLSPTGGYLVGYIFLVAISSFFVKKYANTPTLQIAGCFIGTLVAYILGTLWLSYTTNASFIATLPTGAFIFLPLDTIKIILACYLGRKINLYLQH